MHCRYLPSAHCVFNMLYGRKGQERVFSDSLTIQECSRSECQPSTMQVMGFSMQVLCVFAWTGYKQYGIQAGRLRRSCAKTALAIAAPFL